MFCCAAQVLDSFTAVAAKHRPWLRPPTVLGCKASSKGPNKYKILLEAGSYRRALMTEADVSSADHQVGAGQMMTPPIQSALQHSVPVAIRWSTLRGTPQLSWLVMSLGP